ncbi:acetyl-coenzyme A transporter 1-like [Dendronephthya gigantea]|uniref:acetyl-coenzyme A transporter 1-like n=1 Tax=Dendronephthya gigantea TaxID=151771 RepID=UPI00106B5FF2|nr:acetyl-coenzyme A transporter 1-like [Dendronephthya gigantea]
MVSRRTVIQQVSVDEPEGASQNTSPDEKIQQDRGSIALLLLLYILQGIPLGLTGSIPLILQSRHVAYKDQAMFSFAFWPFSVKLLWAPIVDSVFSRRMGRRKSWLIPTQYLIGLFMIVLSWEADTLLGHDSKDSPINVYKLTALFFSLCFLAATQDIATDGWALTMLSSRNVGYASTCNSVGQTAGYFMGNLCFLALTSPALANKYLRSTPQETGIIKISEFLLCWGLIFVVTTTLVWIFKHEKDLRNNEDVVKRDVSAAYKTAWKIVCLPNVQQLMIILFTIKMGFAVTDAATGLKLIEAGVPKETLAMLAVPMIPIQITLPWIISRYATGPRPLDISLKAMPLRLLMSIVFCLCVWWAHHVRAPGEHDFPTYFYIVLLLFYALHQVTANCMFVSAMTFFARVSDPAVGGTYMTLLNTLSNLGGVWTSTTALWFVDVLTWKSCIGTTNTTDVSCNTKLDEKLCMDSGGTCITDIDGYYIETVICVCIGFLWLRWKRNTTKKLQDQHPSTWKTS